jgi:hypothetical protein
MKNIHKDIRGISKPIVIIIAIVIVISSIGVGAYLYFDDEGAFEDTTCTVFVENSITGEVLSGDVDISDTSVGEQMMLSFNQDIRQVTMEQLSIRPVTGISKTTQYNIWVQVSAMITGEGLSTNTATFSMVATAGVETPTDGDMYWGSVSSNVKLEMSKTIDVSTPSVHQFDTTVKKWNNYVASNNSFPLLGASLDGAWIKCDITVTNGEVTATSTAELEISVTSWDTGSLTIGVTNIGVGGLTDVPSDSIYNLMGIDEIIGKENIIKA